MAMGCDHSPSKKYLSAYHYTAMKHDHILARGTRKTMRGNMVGTRVHTARYSDIPSE
jgi:hypothetical protein